MKLKETLNLGKTDFPMRAGLPNKEPEWQKVWEQADLYRKRQELNEGKPAFHLHDGPPYANGNIHVGHALNKISKISLSVQNQCPVSVHLTFLVGTHMDFQSSKFLQNKV